nr:MAG TPA: hypothetical protein [Caudoviricetes sp.]
MISKEKLQELIDKKEKIYYMQQNDINGVLILLENVSIEENIYKELVLRNNGIGWYLGCSQSYPINSLPLQDLYETEDDAKEFIKYGNITKILKFPFVNYNDFLRGKTIDVENVVSVGKATKFDCIVIWDMVKGKQQIIDYATRENYHKALDIAKNIWLGV